MSLKQREKSASDISSGNNPASAASSATSKSASGSGTAATAPTNLKALANARVVQKNLVFILGIAPSIAARETLGAWEYFGQYGKIEKVTVKKPASSQSSSELAASAYVTYAKASDAHAAILAVDGLSFKGHTIKACLGTTKYCNMFLRNAKCSNPECSYLHEISSMTEAQAREFVVKMKAAAVPVAVRADSRKGVFPPKGSVAGKTAPQKPKPTAAAPSPASPAWGSNSNSSTQVQQQQQQPPASSLPPSSATSAPVIAEEKTSAMTTISVADAIALLHSLGGVEIGEYMRRHPRRKGAQKRDFGPIGGERSPATIILTATRDGRQPRQAPPFTSSRTSIGHGGITRSVPDTATSRLEQNSFLYIF